MKKLYFVVDWDSPRERTWSGTVFGLYSSLKRHFLLHEVHVNLKGIIFRRILQKLKYLKNDLSLNCIKRERKRLTKRNLDKDSIILQFAEVFDSQEYPNNYIYQDLSASYLLYLSHTSPHIFQYSGFAGVSNDAISKRAEEQYEYYKSCNGIFTMGEWLRCDLINRIGIPSDKVHCVGGGINVDRNLILPKKKSNNKILFIGRDFKRKGGHLVYDAFCELLKIQPDVELHVAGPKYNPISNPVAGFFYYGDSNHSTLSELLNKCDIFCMPSYFEAYGLVFIEALCYGLPCIGRKCFEMPYFIEDGITGLLIEEDNVQNLADCMHRLLHDTKIKDEVVKRRNFYIDRYSWDSVTDRMRKVIMGE